jgi:hypothetical protein
MQRRDVATTRTRLLVLALALAAATLAPIAVLASLLS